MEGLEDLSHAALAEHFEEQIGPQRQLVCVPFDELLALKRRDPAASDQFGSQKLRLGRLGQECGRFVELCRVEELKLTEKPGDQASL